MSLPSWERGLKSQDAQSIELEYEVAPLVGAWIEMKLESTVTNMKESLPSWERGLKFLTSMIFHLLRFVAPLVGAWIEIIETYDDGSTKTVAPLVGAWIEI